MNKLAILALAIMGFLVSACGTVEPVCQNVVAYGDPACLQETGDVNDGVSDDGVSDDGVSDDGAADAGNGNGN